MISAFVLGIFAAILLGGVLYARSVEESPTPVMDLGIAPLSEPAAEINLTDQGFSPPALAVKTGTQVNFNNQSAIQMWVASAPHPQHTDYPGFDQLQSGDSYSFTFDKAGVWKFHNHLNPSQFGQITVTP